MLPLPPPPPPPPQQQLGLGNGGQNHYAYGLTNNSPSVFGGNSNQQQQFGQGELNVSDMLLEPTNNLPAYQPQGVDQAGTSLHELLNPDFFNSLQIDENAPWNEQSSGKAQSGEGAMNPIFESNANSLEGHFPICDQATFVQLTMDQKRIRHAWDDDFLESLFGNEPLPRDSLISYDCGLAIVVAFSMQRLGLLYSVCLHKFRNMHILRMISGRCAACKHLRRRCPSDCIFSPYFPSNNPQRFACVHRIYGASNVAKMLQQLPAHLRAEAANSLHYEAQCRTQDPVYGCVGILSLLHQQIHSVESQLAKTKAEIAVLSSLAQQPSQIQENEVEASANNFLVGQDNAVGQINHSTNISSQFM
ncbi:unnamed protein product [Dovyalis caffra]|uniref:LOB domain-containing protein n=1 Tax=Dovyalis caffra TaxID=77055 RepID=A0AAV1RKA0_9ROSI|nr:unnamed protein product [Dovyalis caffra]